jgi:hypothetical protein
MKHIVGPPSIALSQPVLGTVVSEPPVGAVEEDKFSNFKVTFLK